MASVRIELWGACFGGCVLKVSLKAVKINKLEDACYILLFLSLFWKTIFLYIVSTIWYIMFNRRQRFRLITFYQVFL